MKKKFRLLAALLIISLCSFFIVGCGDDDSGVRKGSKAKAEDKTDYKYTVYLITMNQGSNYWKQINDGCVEAVKKLGNVRYEWSAPINGKDEEQVECIDKAVADGANAIIISVISPDGQKEALERADKAGVKIIYVDSFSDYPGLAVLRTNNETAGHLAAQTMKKALAEKGITSGIIGIGGNTVARNGIMRDKGFRAEFEGTAFVIPPTKDMNKDRRNIKNFVKEHADYVAFFGANEQVTSAMCEQVNDMDIHPIIVGFDTSDYTLTQIQNGVLYATMQQKPKQMGYDGVMLAYDALEGKYQGKNEDRDMGVEVITKDKI